ncbi:MAG: hypothetical protein MI700_13690, partial [Balneolales bacterium]|nr:hypothetical protein [Balneolales bacterium]
MQNVRVQFTIPSVEKVANLDVYVNGEQRSMKFRVETFDWDEKTGSTENLVSVLRDRILNYDSDWELYHIGTPYEGAIPVTFRFKSDQTQA